MTNEISLSAQVSRVINQFLFLEKRSVFTHRDVTLHPSEIHLMGALMRDADANVTTMAETLGITKGAVSQTISRLVKKGMVSKIRDPRNKNELKVSFTASGRKAIEAFARSRAEANGRYEAYLDGLSNTERQTIRTFLAQVEQMIAGLR